MMRRNFLSIGADKRGAAIIELALVAPLFALVVAGIVDLSNAYSRKLALEQGAQRAIEKIMQTTGDSTVENTLTTEAVCQVNGLNSDGTCKTSPISASDVTVTYRIECTTVGTGAISAQTQSDPDLFNAIVCPTGTKTSRFIQVSVVDKYRPLFPIHFGSFNSSDGSYHMSAVAGMRTQ